MIGPVPILFVGVGPCAEKALAEFSSAVKGLTVPVRGPFGLVLVDSFGEELFTCDWPWISEFKLPESPLIRERSEFIGDDDGKLTASLSSLARRLRSAEPGADPASSGRIRMSSYVVVDLSVSGAVASAVRLMQVLRRIDPAHDVTVLGLTARTAVTGSASDSEWFGAWKQLLARLQDTSFAQRIYLLDGCDADKVWFERPEQLHHLAAQFLLYHGLLCRGPLRQNERARTGAKESLLNVCGSFGCRAIVPDLSVVAERVAEQVAREDLADLYGRTVPAGWLESVDEQAKSLVDKIAIVCEKAHEAKPASSGERRGRAGGYIPGSADVSEAVAKTIKQVCSREPLVSLCHFFKCLQPRLGRLLNTQRLRERSRTRQLVAELIQQQDAATYEPMRIWLSDTKTQWVDRFTPKQHEPPRVAVSRPAGMAGYTAGCVFLVLGLIGIGAGLLAGDRLFAIGGGLLVVAASALMTFPTGWALYPRNRVREGQDVSKSVPPVSYRKRAPGWALGTAGGLIVVGLAAVTWPLWPEAWSAVTVVWAIVLAVIAGTGAGFIVRCPTESHRDKIGGDEAPSHMSPPVWRCRGVGLLCLALAWAVFGLWASWPAAYTTAQWGLALMGQLMIGTGVGLALLPRAGRIYLIDRVPKMPQPLAGGIARPAGENDLDRTIAAMAAWIDHLALEPDQCLQRSGAKDASTHRETLFDFLAADWDSQLAEAFRRELKARSDKPLKALAGESVLWAECVTKEFQDARTVCPDLAFLFALQVVKAWAESHTPAELLSFLRADMPRFGRLVERLASPHWPATRGEPDTTTHIIAVGKSLWDMVSPLAEVEGAPALVQLDWDSHAEAVLALHVVQGLGQGWRGFPGMPGQLHERPPATPADPDNTSGSESHSDISRRR